MANFSDPYFSNPTNFPFLPKSGEMGTLISQFEWSKTPLGEVASWPQSLRTTLGILLHSKFPMFLFWGEELLCFYNDAYRPSLGLAGKHPAALGKPGEKVWPEIWPVIQPFIERVLSGGEATWSEDQLIPIYRNGKLEDVYWTFSYSPVHDERGKIGGVFVTCSETTLKVQAFKKLAESETSLKSLFVQAPAAIAVVAGPDQRYVVANPLYQKLFNRTEEQLIGKTIREVFPEIERQGIAGLFEHVYQSGQAFTASEFVVFFDRTSTGELEEGYFNFVAQPITDPQGKVNAIMIHAFEVTELVMERKKVAESEMRFRNMVEQAPVAIAVFRGDTFVTEIANEAYLPLVGKTKKDFIGKPLFEALPETREVLEPLARELMATGKSFPASEFEIILNRQGKPEACYFNSIWEPYYENDGRINGFIVVAHEVTQQVLARKKLEESEAQIRAMVESAPFPIGVYVGRERRIQLANQAMMDVWGKGYDVISKLYDQILPELTDQQLFTQLDQVYNTGIAFHAKNQRVDLVVEDKLQPFYFNYSFTPLFDAQGKVYGVMNTAANVTDLALARKRSEQSEQEAQRLAEELQTANEEILANNEDLKAVNNQLIRTNIDLDNFIYTASHDLKAPISNIEALLSALLRTLPAESFSSERAKRITSSMGESVERFKKTIANLTEVVKLQKENSAEADSVNLSRVIEEVRLDLEPQIKEAKVQVELNIASCPTIHFSEKNLRSVIYNLLSNGIKYRSLERAPIVHISYESTPIYHVLAIKDNGLGIARERIDQLFTMFKRFHDHVEGTGIGLYMVKKMVENAGGKIEVDSLVGVGSTFKVYLKQ